MDLFKKLNDILGEGNTLTLAVSAKKGVMTVSVMPGNPAVKDAATAKLVPLNVSGTPEELDEGFIEAIARPVAATTGLLTNMAQYEKSLAEAKAKTKMEEDRKTAESSKKKECADYTALANKNLAECKFKDALTCVATAEKSATTPAEKTALATLKKEIKSKQGEGALFGAAEDKSDGKNIGAATAGNEDATSGEETETDND